MAQVILSATSLEAECLAKLNENLERETVDKWAKPIIDHFRGNARGGAYYRQLTEPEREVA